MTKWARNMSGGYRQTQWSAVTGVSEDSPYRGGIEQRLIAHMMTYVGRQGAD